MPERQTLEKILIVDDQYLMCKMLADMLSDDYIVKTVSSGEEGLNVLPLFDPSLVLVDIMLPGMNGIEVCRSIRQDPNFRCVKVIMITAQKLETADRLEGYRAGTDDYILKPFDYDELKHKIRVFLHMKRIEEVDQISGYLLRRFSIEVRSSLNGILQPAKSIIRHHLADLEKEQLAKIILKSAEKLESFVQKSMLFSDFLKGFTPVTRIDYLNRHIHATVQEYKEELSWKSVRVSLLFSEEMEIPADWNMLDYAIRFLLENAIEHSPSGGEIGITTSIEREMIKIAIADQGEGVVPDIVDKYLDGCKYMHYLAKTDDCKGFSLALVKKIVNAHGGSISCFNNKDRGGATFYIALPIPH